MSFNIVNDDSKKESIQYYKDLIIKNLIMFETKVSSLSKVQIELCQEYTEHFIADLCNFVETDDTTEFEYIDDLNIYYDNLWLGKKVSKTVYNHINTGEYSDNKTIMKHLALEYNPLNYKLKL